MGLIKWLKSEIDLSPALRKASNRTPGSGKKTELSRNESYLKALTKFNKWRQSQLKSVANKQDKNKTATANLDDEPTSSANTAAQADANSNHYEEIYSNVEEASGYNHVDNPYYATANACELGLDVKDDDDDDEEHVYSLPLLHYAPTSSTRHDELLDENFDASTDEKSDAVEEFRRNTVVTDLDKSQEFMSAIAEENHSLSDVTTLAAEEVSYTADLKLLSETMVYTLQDIKIHDEYPQCHMKNLFIRHGEVHAMAISFMESKRCDYNIIHSNSEAIRKLRHPNIILLMGISLDENSKLTATITEPVECSLYDRIYYRENYIPLETCHTYASQLANAVGYLHARALIHSNICSENVLLCRTAGLIKLAGFELCSMSTTKSNLQQLCVAYRRKYSTYFYQAPELLSNTTDYITPTFQSDIYGICLTLWEMLNCVIPYMQFSYDELLAVCALKKAQLTAYHQERQQPYKTILEKGLEIESVQRFRNTIELQDALKRMQHANRDSETDAHNFNNTFEKPFRNSHDFKVMKNHSTLRSNNQNLNESLQSSSFKSESLEHYLGITTPISRQTPEKILHNHKNVQKRSTPNRRYNVSILFKSKNKACGSLKSEQHVSISPSVTQHQHRYENFEMGLNSPLGSYTTNVASESDNMVEKIQCTHCKRNNRIGKENNAAVWKTKGRSHMVSTEDFYIDDDFANHTHVGANFQMEFNYECL